MKYLERLVAHYKDLFAKLQRSETLGFRSSKGKYVDLDWPFRADMNALAGSAEVLEVLKVEESKISALLKILDESEPIEVRQFKHRDGAGRRKDLWKVEAERELKDLGIVRDTREEIYRALRLTSKKTSRPRSTSLP